MDIGPLKLAQTLGSDQAKDPASITQMTLPLDSSLALPDSFYDYIPHAQVASPDRTIPSDTRFSRGVCWNLKSTFRCPLNILVSRPVLVLTSALRWIVSLLYAAP